MSSSTMNYNGWSTIGGTSPEQVEQELPFPTDAKNENTPLTELLWDEGGKWDVLTSLAKEAPAGEEILVAGLDVVEMLLEKNISYSNSAMDPLNVLSNATPEDQIKMHIDNKLTRLKYQKEFQNEDSLKDLAGYVILLMVLKSDK